MFHFKMRKNKKVGLFMSIELIASIIVLMGLVTAVAVAVFLLKDIYKVYTVTREFKMYSEAISRFKTIYNYWPGDIPLNNLKAELNSNVTKVNVYNVTNNGNTVCSTPSGAIPLMTAQGGTCTTSSTAIGVPTSPYPQTATGAVEFYKQHLAFQQLALTGLISGNLVNQNYVLPATYWSNATNKYGNTIPLATFNATFAFNYNVYPYTATGNIYIPLEGVFFTSGTGSLRPIYINNLTNKAIITLSSAGCFTTSNYGPNANGYYCGSISANTAYDIDQKIDDSFPHGPNGKFFAESSRISGGWGCVDYTSLPGTDATLVTAKYKDNNLELPDEGCIVSMVVDHNE